MSNQDMFNKKVDDVVSSVDQKIKEISDKGIKLEDCSNKDLVEMFQDLRSFF
jgi:hypothetical protein